MSYVKARYQPPDPLTPGGPRQVQTLDDQGGLWALTEDSQVGDWLRYLEEGGTIEPEGAEWPEVDNVSENEPASDSGTTTE